MNTMAYKGYVGAFDYDPEADLFHGEVVNLRDVVTFQGRSVEELKQALAESVEDYLDFCRQEGVEPGKPYSGKLHLRIGPDLHRAAAGAAAVSGKSLNAWIVDAMAESLRHTR